MSDIEFTRVYLDTFKDLCLLALRYVHSASVAEDIVQESFCKVLVRHPEVFRPEDNSQVRAYMWRVVRNKSIDWCRTHSGRFDSLEERLLDSELSLLVDGLIAPEGCGNYDYDLAVFPPCRPERARFSCFAARKGFQTKTSPRSWALP